MLYNKTPPDFNFDVVFIDDISIILVDLDTGKSVTNDAYKIVKLLDSTILPGGIKTRRVYYRDTMGRFDQMKTFNGIFTGFDPCTPAQQEFLKKLVETKKNQETEETKN